MLQLFLVFDASDAPLYAKLTGHKTESVYRRYAIAGERDLRVAAENIDALICQASAPLISDGRQR